MREGAVECDWAAGAAAMWVGIPICCCAPAMLRCCRSTFNSDPGIALHSGAYRYAEAFQVEALAGL